jgi:excisionase family DNA binding protein
MSEDVLSPHQVAEILGLHVRTVRNYVRDGRLPARRIGKQYRIAREDLEAFAGKGAGRSGQARRQRHVEVASVVDIEVVDPATATRITNGLMGTARSRPQGDRHALRVECIYNEGRARLKIIVSGDLDATTYLLKLVELYLEP